MPTQTCQAISSIERSIHAALSAAFLYGYTSSRTLQAQPSFLAVTSQAWLKQPSQQSPQIAYSLVSFLSLSITVPNVVGHSLLEGSASAAGIASHDPRAPTKTAHRGAGLAISLCQRCANHPSFSTTSSLTSL